MGSKSAEGGYENRSNNVCLESSIKLTLLPARAKTLPMHKAVQITSGKHKDKIAFMSSIPSPLKLKLFST